MPELKHELKIAIDGQTIREWLTYDIKVSLLHPAGSFNLGMPWSYALFQLCKTDRRIKITIDDAPVLVGHTSSRDTKRASRMLTIAGYDKVARLVAESAPSVDYRGLKASQLIEQLASPWFTKVVLSNTRNRTVARGRRGHKVRDSGKVFIDSKPGAGTRIVPGQFRWTAIQTIARQMGAVVWASADGQELIVGQPDYRQEVQFVFSPENVIDLGHKDSTDDRYSYYLLLGAGAGTDANYGYATASRSGLAKDNGATAGGEGKDFGEPKRLVMADRTDFSSREEAQREAALEMARRNMKKHLVHVEAPGHGQVVRAGAARTLFTLDCLADVRDPEAKLSGRYVIVDCNYRGEREGSGETTQLELMRGGQLLVA